jgi:dTDP-alpha-D-glucuronic acid decarboxylase
VRDAVALVADLIGSGVEVVSVDTRGALGKDYEDLSRRIPDNTKARTLLGWECATSLRDGVRATVDWAKQNPEWLAQPDGGVSPQ